MPTLALNCLWYSETLFLGGPSNEGSFEPSVHDTREPGASIRLTFMGTSFEGRSTSEEEPGAPTPTSTPVLDPDNFTAQPNPTVTVSGTSPHALTPGIVFGIAMGSVVLLGAVVAALVYLYLAERRLRNPTDHESGDKLLWAPKQKATRVSAFVSRSSKQMLVVPPTKDAPPVATTRYEYPSEKISPPKPVSKRGLPSGGRLRPGNGPRPSPPRKMVVNI
ncbi:hypothetical protein B0H17DRAFT_1195602 [Mycena rosella]|uniref:Uncharacterized protein n=1 Tax=Mycena rosella TaxID=1033263 RepID=A0AAD7DVI7_MYCRO|nr:hypothetical protein B0H17DRAFT_1195602 [Mycena rosella]